MQITEETLTKMYVDMLKIRAFEEHVDNFISRGEITGTTHLYIGEEAVAVGACNAIKKEDYIASHHRGHGHCLAKGADVNRMMAELFGKETGFCRGRGGSLHIADMSTNNLGATGIVGAGIPVATGAALAMKMQGEDRVVVNFLGDGAMNQGTFHEAVNLASIWDLPVIYIVENNQYGMSMAVERAFNIDDLSIRAQSYGIHGDTIDGNDIFAVHESVAKAVRRARDGEGPSLIVAETYRWKGHSKSDTKEYRTKEEEERWKEKDPIARLEEYLLAEGIINEEKIEEIKRGVDSELEEAVEFAKESPYPAKDTVYEDVYAGEGY